MLYFIIILLMLSVIWLSMKSKSLDVTYIQKKLYPYSGLNPELFHKFVNSLSLFGQNINYVDESAKYAYSALDYAIELQKYDERHDFRKEIDEIALECEKLLLNSALLNKVSFKPRYLNEMHNI